MNCPFCGVERVPETEHPLWVCGTTQSKWGIERYERCFENELDQLRTALAECQADLKQAIIQQDDLLETVMKQADELAKCQAKLIPIHGPILCDSCRSEVYGISYTSIPQAELDALREVELKAREMLFRHNSYRLPSMVAVEQALAKLDGAREKDNG